jgi:hypothetical protein
MLPSEFKSNWESLVKDQIMEAFENSFLDYNLITYLVQDTLKIIYEESLELIKEKIRNLLNTLNIIKNETDVDIENNKNETEKKNLKIKINNKSEFTFLDYEKFLCKFRLIFQEYFSVIFQLNDLNILNKIKEKLKNIINNDNVYSNISTEKLELIDEDINSKFFKEYFSSVFKLCLYMHLHEPKLTINLPSAFSYYEKEKNNTKTSSNFNSNNIAFSAIDSDNNNKSTRELCFFYYKKDEFINIEGFPKEKSSCVVILPYPTLRGNYSYQGIKPAVYIIPKPNDDIIRICEENNLIDIEKNKDKEKEKDKPENKNKFNDKEKDKDKKIIVDICDLNDNNFDQINLDLENCKDNDNYNNENDNNINNKICEIFSFNGNIKDIKDKDNTNLLISKIDKNDNNNYNPSNNNNNDKNKIKTNDILNEKKIEIEKEKEISINNNNNNDNKKHEKKENILIENKYKEKDYKLTPERLNIEKDKNLFEKINKNIKEEKQVEQDKPEISISEKETPKLGGKNNIKNTINISPIYPNNNSNINQNQDLNSIKNYQNFAKTKPINQSISGPIIGSANIVPNTGLGFASASGLGYNIPQKYNHSKNHSHLITNQAKNLMNANANAYMNKNINTNLNNNIKGVKEIELEREREIEREREDYIYNSNKEQKEKGK